MPRNGYWIECVPVEEQANRDYFDRQRDERAEKLFAERMYAATAESFPDIAEMAPSPDQAIEKLRTRLKNIRADYEDHGRLLPELDNPVKPPQRLRNVTGWISVYVEFADKSA